MKTVKVRELLIGDGIPKKCVPVVGVTREEILQEAKAISQMPAADLVEWRADWYEDIWDREKTKEVLVSLREILGELPLLFTFRTAKEGGEKAIAPDTYAALNKEAAQIGLVDLIDVEIFTGDEQVKDILSFAHASGVKVIASNHDFAKTPDKGEIIRRLRIMQKFGADIAKIAVMPQTRQDVLTLLAATEEMSRLYPGCPIVTMSMSGMGMISRLCGEIFGSAITFGAAKKASAPGQIRVEQLDDILHLIHRHLK